MSLDFKISNTERNATDGGITNVHWTVSKTIEGTTASSYGSTALTYDSAAPDFVPYLEVTEEQAIEWLKAALTEETLLNMEASLDASIEHQKNPPVVQGLPWVDATVVDDGESDEPDEIPE